MGFTAVSIARSLTRHVRVAWLLAGSLTAVAGASGCMMGTSRAQRVQEAAYELNMGLRFGYNGQALGKVASEHKREFLRQHRDWSQRLRIVDLDLAGLEINEKGDGDVYVTVLWQPVDETTVRTTVIHQTWKDQKGTWMLVAEERSQGEQGLINETGDKKQDESEPKSKEPRTKAGPGDKPDADAKSDKPAAKSDTTK